ncbi:hypothetical protein MMC21_005330 [Puttea exsequens]|nr:hypothetical protein [Puttea exsequens]
MSQLTGHRELPPYLLDRWRLAPCAELTAKYEQQFKRWTASSLAEAFLEYQLRKLNQSLAERSGACCNSLFDTVVNGIVSALQTSEDLPRDVQTIGNCLESVPLGKLLNHQRLPYKLLRLFYDTSPVCADGRALVDLDEAVLGNERYCRALPLGDPKRRLLLKLEDLCDILPGIPSDEGYMTFKRKNPPKGGLEVLDEKRAMKLTIHSSSVTYRETFDRITRGILRGLDWANVFWAGGMALATLLHCDPSSDEKKAVRDPDLDLYLYGLTAAEANTKAEHVHDIWASNLPPGASKLVVKSPKTINLISDYPNRRIQIILKLLPTPTDILLNFDLDACAIGFDGTKVLMLPRCARAIETGYSVFTMDLIWGHHLSDRRGSQETRIIKYAERGFGIRFLPSYARFLEDDDRRQKKKMAGGVGNKTDSGNRPPTDGLVMSDPNKEGSGVGTTSSDGDLGGLDFSESDDRNGRSLPLDDIRPRDWKPHGQEPGLKTLRRVHYWAKEFVDCLYIGDSPLAKCPIKVSSPLLRANYEAQWLERYQGARKRKRRLLQRNTALAEFGSYNLNNSFADGRQGLEIMEIFLKHCEAWRLSAQGKVILPLNENSNFGYNDDHQTYDLVSNYTWDEHFNIDSLTREIDRSNNYLWICAKVEICAKLGLPARAVGFRDYVTRRIRHQLYGSDLASVQERQITMPIMIPRVLETYINTIASSPLIPMHDSTKYSASPGVLPTLRDNYTEAGNLRFWVLTNESMWTHQDRTQDEIRELLWDLFNWYKDATVASQLAGRERSIATDQEDCMWKLARSFRQRLVLAEVTDSEMGDASTALLSTSREAMLFKQWALASVSMDGNIMSKNWTARSFCESMEIELRYPFEDDLFWKDGDEGKWAPDDVPPWIDV